MPTRLALLLIAGLLPWSPGPAPAAEPAREPCGVPRELANLEGALPRTYARIAARQPLKIVALGSSSTYGTGASNAEASYPRQLEIDLIERLPASHPEVINRGIPGDTAEDMLARLDHDVLAEKPDLVIWQTGTNDIEKGVTLDRFHQLTMDGLARLKAAGVDVILMEPQYYPKLVMKPVYVGYLSDLRAIGEQQGIPVMRRFDIMLHWIQSGEFIYATMLAGDAFHMKDRSYACIARVMANEIARAAGSVGRKIERFASRHGGEPAAPVAVAEPHDLHSPALQSPALHATALTTSASAAK
jgi:lysophospholipase L1-like esterase